MIRYYFRIKPVDELDRVFIVNLLHKRLADVVDKVETKIEDLDVLLMIQGEVQLELEDGQKIIRRLSRGKPRFVVQRGIL